MSSSGLPSEDAAPSTSEEFEFKVGSSIIIFLVGIGVVLLFFLPLVMLCCHYSHLNRRERRQLQKQRDMESRLPAKPELPAEDAGLGVRGGRSIFELAQPGAPEAGGHAVHEVDGPFDREAGGQSRSELGAGYEVGGEKIEFGLELDGRERFELSGDERKSNARDNDDDDDDNDDDVMLSSSAGESTTEAEHQTPTPPSLPSPSGWRSRPASQI